jgi:hypothetical protein
MKGTLLRAPRGQKATLGQPLEQEEKVAGVKDMILVALHGSRSFVSNKGCRKKSFVFSAPHL